MLLKGAMALSAATMSVAASHPPAITAIRPLALHNGVNVIPHFLPNGGHATIVQAWRDNGNAHGYVDWLVLSSPANANSPSVVTLENPRTHLLEDTIRDEPFDGERIVEQVIFARGRIDGKPASLLISSRLDDTPGMAFGARARVTVRIFDLTATDSGPGETPYEFRLADTIHTTRQYCNAELALSQTLKLPLSSDYAGPNKIDGCY